MPSLAAGSRLLLVESEVARSTLAWRLEAAASRLDRAASWREGLSLAVRDEHHLILIDRVLPEIDGLALVRILRACGLATPMLVFSASDNAQAHRDAHSAGADGHLAASFTEAEMLARVAALARPPTKRTKPTVLWVADLKIDLRERTAVRAGQYIPLRGLDFDVLAYLTQRRGRPVSHASLLQDIWGRRGDSGRRVVKQSVDRVRRAVDEGFSLELIHAVPGVGYVLLGDRD